VFMSTFLYDCRFDNHTEPKQVRDCVFRCAYCLSLWVVPQEATDRMCVLTVRKRLFSSRYSQLPLIHYNPINSVE